MKEERVKALLAKRKFQYKGKIFWEKLTHLGNTVSGSGVTVRHCTETCYIFQRGVTSGFAKLHKANDLIRAKVRGESVKPDEIYQEIRKLVPIGHGLEIFCRSHHIQKNMVCAGNQLRQH